MQVKVKYREKDGRKIAVEIESKVYYESKGAQKDADY